MKTKGLITVLILYSIITLIACGGGGGGGTVTTPSLSYSGSTSAAVINETNAAISAVGAVNGGIKGNSFTLSASLTNVTDTPDQSNVNAFSTAIVMQNAVYELVANSEDSVKADRSVYSEPEVIDGPCGGQAAGVVNIDDVTGNFWGDLTFTNYCDANVTLNGKVNFSGTIDLVFGSFVNLSLSFDYLRGIDPSGSYIFDGSISIDFITSSRFTLAMDMLLQDSSTSKVYWINNYLLDVEDFGGNVSMNISGRFYEPSYGYVTISTQQDIIVDISDIYPSSGVIIIVGEIGSSGGQTNAMLTCFPNDIFQIEADIDGDGAYDWFSGDLSWLNY